jgi:predicted PurR-regulated permease PerM
VEEITEPNERADRMRSVPLALTVLAVLAVLYTLFTARSFLVPIAYALLLNQLLSPVVRALGRLRIPTPAAAAVVVLALIGALVFSVYTLAGPVEKWVSNAPAMLADVANTLRPVTRPLQRVQKTAEQVERQAAPTTSPAKPAPVEVRGPSLWSRLFGTTQRLLAAVAEVLVLLYFLLAAGDLFLQKLIKVIPSISDKKKAVRIAREAESSVSVYLSTVAAMNVLEGVVVAGAMFLLGMPTPALWGALVLVLEFIPYLGAAVAVVSIGIAALTTFHNVGYALLAPLAFLVINLVQANLVSPIVLGYRLSLNPVALFVGLCFWFWIWGIPGAFIAVPLMATLKILCDHVEPFAAVGEFLGQRDTHARGASSAVSAPA